MYIGVDLIYMVINQLAKQLKNVESLEEAKEIGEEMERLTKLRVKAGMTLNKVRRLKDFQSNCPSYEFPFTYHYEGLICNDKKMEKYMKNLETGFHVYCDELHIQRELFQVSTFEKLEKIAYGFLKSSYCPRVKGKLPLIHSYIDDVIDD
jgi:hypothetical protein